MNDATFYNELWIACYKAQIDGYPIGHPNRMNFQPIVPYKKNEDGTYNRADTLDMASYSWVFAPKARALLLETS